MTETSPTAPAITKTRQLGTFAASITYDNLPAEVTHYGKRALVDWIAAALAGADQPGARKVRQVVAELVQDGPASVIGTTLSTTPPFAALANAYAAHLLDYDDVFNPIETTIHLSSCVWPVVLAIGQLRKLSGKQVIAAYVAGFEVGARVARAAGPTHYESAWHVTGTMGHVAAAAAAANALGLSAAEATHALGCSATQASGLREIYGSDTKALHPGKAAMDGVLAGLLAEVGFTSTDTAIEGQRGLLRAVSSAPNDALLVDGLGTEWNLPENGNKLYPTASLTHPAIEAASSLAREYGVLPDDIRGIEIRMHPFPAAVTALAQPSNGAGARFSTPHCIAVALSTGGLGLGDFSDAVVHDPSIARLRGLVRIIADPDMDKRGCLLTVERAGGAPLRHEVYRNRGTPAAPLQDADLAEKLATAAATVMDAGSAAELIEACWALETVSDINQLVARMAGAVPA